MAALKFIEVTTFDGNTYSININFIAYVKYESGLTTLLVGGDYLRVKEMYNDVIEAIKNA